MGHERFATALRREDIERLRGSGQWSNDTVGSRLAQTCARHAEKVALVDAERRLTFGELDRLSARLARGLTALGVKAGDAVAYQLPNWWEGVVIFLAAARIGAVANPLLPLFRQRELSFILRQSGASVLLIPGNFRNYDYRPLVRDIEFGLPALRHVLVVRDIPGPGMQSFSHFLEAVPDAAESASAGAAVAAGSLLLLMYTSGTTADPKGVLHTHQTLIAEVDSLARVHGLDPRDLTLMPSPLAHISGVVHAILVPALLGTAAVLMERWDPTAALGLIARERVSYMVGAPTFLMDLCADYDRDVHDVSSLRLFSCGGANVSADLIRRARSTLGCVAKRVYGSTEFPTITTTDAGDAMTQGADTEGRVIAPAELRVIDEAGGAVAVGQEGEIEARGPECFVGYADVALNADAFTGDGWFRTGDLGTVDAGGYLRITGRVKEIVIRKGEKFSVRELENWVLRHPAIADVAIVGVPDERTGERACAVVQLHPGQQLTLTELTEFLRREGMATQKLPEQLVLHPALPRTESGKVHRAAVRNWIKEGG